MEMAKESGGQPLENAHSAQSSSRGTGTGNTSDTPMLRDKKQTTVSISIVLLDHSEVVFNVNKRDRGKVLLDSIFQHLRVTETKFFGLQFPNDVPDTMRWLDPTKSIRKQFRRGYPFILFFRIKFYATDISSMKDEFTRYQLFLQIKLDLLEKRLHCPASIAAMIASYAVQSELGDYNHLEHRNNYIMGMKFLPNQSEEFEAEVQRLHKMHKGLSPAQAEFYAIKKAQKLDLYGVEIHHAKDSVEEDLDVGVTSNGMLFYQNGFRSHQFKWSSIVKISFKRKQFFVQLRDTPQTPHDFPDLVFAFHMDNYRACKRLWKSCVDFHSFYRMDRCMNSSYVHKHIPDDSASSQAADAKFDKNMFAFLTLGGKQKNKDIDSFSNEDEVRHRQYLRSRSGSAKSKENLTYLKEEKVMNDEKAPRRLSAPPSVSYGVGSSFLTDEELISMLQSNSQLDNSSSSSEKHNKSVKDLKGISNAESTESFEVLPSPAKFEIEMHSPDPALTDTFRPLNVRANTAAEVSGSVSSSYSNAKSENNSMPGSQSEKSYVFPDSNSLPFPHQSSGKQSNGIPEGLRVVRLKPDKDGRYGFNVKGGADQNMVVTVSKVAENSPASLCIPRLNVGDHVLQINGRDISGHSHEQVVRFIRSTSEQHSSSLVLLILPAQPKPATDQQPESFLQPISSKNGISHYDTGMQDEGALLHNSMQWMEDMLDSGELLAMFNSLYRKKPGSTMNDARLPINISKNRYRDISPYDNTRVQIYSGSSDYINANYVNMHIPGIDWTNLYIASQGPLMNTTVDFWTMVWESNASLIVMLTTVVEQGRPKCHQYWPDAGNVAQFGPWRVESISEEVSTSFAYRDFVLSCCHGQNEKETLESRPVRQMQYIAWPDHGVPDDSSDFLDFVLQVRQNRVGMGFPCVVHCSAGIGRTGVLITMETAMCLIEANQPVYPIEITRAMRDQRAMMIQTPGQFKFVCEAILRVYKEGLAKPIIAGDQEGSDDAVDTNLIGRSTDSVQ